MSFTATVENDTIKLPPGVHLPNGTKVTVEPAKEKASPADASQSVRTFMEKFSGCVNSGLGDAAENHDHYAHGAPKGTDRI